MVPKVSRVVPNVKRALAIVFITLGTIRVGIAICKRDVSAWFRIRRILVCSLRHLTVFGS